MQRVSLLLVQSPAMLDHQRAKGECVSLLARFLPVSGLVLQRKR